MKNSIEYLTRMSANTGTIERAEIADSGEKVLRGYAVVFNEPYKMSDGWTERVDPKAFDGVDLSSVVLLRDHNYERLLGKVGKNLRLEFDERGLFFECKLPNTPLADETYELAQREILDGCSFGFKPKEIKSDRGNKTDTITKIDWLREITITPVPAYRQTVVTTLCEARQEAITAEKAKRCTEVQGHEADTKSLLKASAENGGHEADSKDLLEVEAKRALEAEKIEILKKLGVEV